MKMEYLTDEDGEPWAVFVRGECPEAITRQDVIDAMNEWPHQAGDEWASNNPELPRVQVFHFTDIPPEDEELTDCLYWVCKPGDPGAFVVTGLKGRALK